MSWEEALKEAIEMLRPFSLRLRSGRWMPYGCYCKVRL